MQRSPFSCDRAPGSHRFTPQAATATTTNTITSGMNPWIEAPDHFGTYLAAGLVLSIVMQAMINVSVVLGLLPTKGIPLPFISAGGSSLLATMVAVGLLLNVSQHGD